MEQEKTQQEEKKQNSVLAVKLRRKGILLGAAFVLLIVLLVMGATAWYTRVAEVSGINMEVAEYDFNANFQNENFMLNAYDYLAKDNYKIAPGGGGVVPIMVSTSNSAIDVEYTLGLAVEDMAPEFLRRLRFFYYDQSGTERTIQPDSVGIRGSLEQGVSQKTEYIYWEWVYDLNPVRYFDRTKGQRGQWVDNSAMKTGTNRLINSDGSINTGSTYYLAFENYLTSTEGLGYSSVQEAIDAHDALDTQIGRGFLNDAFPTTDANGTPTTIYAVTGVAIKPMNGGDSYTTTLSAVQKAMEVRILITGAQANPTKLSEVPPQTGTTKYVGKQPDGPDGQTHGGN